MEQTEKEREANQRISKTKKILVVAAHPDDEVLGCGGTIARYAKEGHEVNILIMAEGETSRHKHRDRDGAKSILYSLGKAAKKSCKLLGVKKLEMLDLPDNRLDSIDRLELVKLIEERITEQQPDTVFVHHIGDVNIDHRRIHEAVVTACRPTPGHAVKRLLSYEVASSTEWQVPGSQSSFQPNYYLDISRYWNQKKQALDAYATEMRQWPHPRSIEAVGYLAKLRGAQVGVDAAEAFCLLRSIQ